MGHQRENCLRVDVLEDVKRWGRRIAFGQNVNFEDRWEWDFSDRRVDGWGIVSCSAWFVLASHSGD